MWISTKAQYGLRALVEIGQKDKHALSLKEVAERQGISQHYLEQIASTLRRAGLVRSVRGAHGGYKLSRLPEHITAWEVVTVLEGSLSPVTCLEDAQSCSHIGACATEGLWKRVEDALKTVLQGTTLAHLIAENKAIEHNRLIQLEPRLSTG